MAEVLAMDGSPRQPGSARSKETVFCHRLIHHATVKETRPMLDSLFANRASLTQQFKVDKITLYRFYNCEEILSD
jgi:hypothetical protein